MPRRSRSARPPRPPRPSPRFRRTRPSRSAPMTRASTKPRSSRPACWPKKSTTLGLPSFRAIPRAAPVQARIQVRLRIRECLRHPRPWSLRPSGPIRLSCLIRRLGLRARRPFHLRQCLRLRARRPFHLRQCLRLRARPIPILRRAPLFHRSFPFLPCRVRPPLPPDPSRRLHPFRALLCRPPMRGPRPRFHPCLPPRRRTNPTSPKPLVLRTASLPPFRLQLPTSPMTNPARKARAKAARPRASPSRHLTGGAREAGLPLRRESSLLPPLPARPIRFPMARAPLPSRRFRRPPPPRCPPNSLSLLRALCLPHHPLQRRGI